MSKMFIRCMGKTACQEDETHCRTCGRTIEEIYETRALVDGLVNFAKEMGYQNADMFFEYVADKTAKKANHLEHQAGNQSTESHEYH